MRYIIQEQEQGSTKAITIDSFTSKKKAEFYLNEYRAYKPTSIFTLIERV